MKSLTQHINETVDENVSESFDVNKFDDIDKSALKSLKKLIPTLRQELDNAYLAINGTSREFKNFIEESNISAYKDFESLREKLQKFDKAIDKLKL